MSKLVEELIKLVESKETYPYLKFGAKFALEIENSNYTPKDILDKAGFSPSYQAEINKGISVFNYLNKIIMTQ
jgi:hypothetical protein